MIVIVITKSRHCYHVKCSNVQVGPTTMGLVFGSDAMVAMSNPCAATRAGGVNASHLKQRF